MWYIMQAALTVQKHIKIYNNEYNYIIMYKYAK